MDEAEIAATLADHTDFVKKLLMLAGESEESAVERTAGSRAEAEAWELKAAMA